MSQLTIKLSDKADALIAQLQKEIFNRRRKKVSAAGVVETLVESGAKSQSDKRFATSWKNLIGDIEKAAKLANAHGSKPANLTDAEWAMVLSHRARSTRPNASPKATKPATAKAAPARKAAAKPAAKAKPKPAKAARNPVKKAAVKAPAKAKPGASGSSVARRMAKAVSRLSVAAPAAPSSNGAAQLSSIS
jgi:hypothetical protein